MSSGRPFHSFGPAKSNDRSSTVTRRDETVGWNWKLSKVSTERAGQQRGSTDQTGRTTNIVHRHIVQLRHRKGATTRVWKTDVGTNRQIGYCAVDARRQSNE